MYFFTHTVKSVSGIAAHVSSELQTFPRVPWQSGTDSAAVAVLAIIAAAIAIVAGMTNLIANPEMRSVRGMALLL
jgi:hypothetical protein